MEFSANSFVRPPTPPKEKEISEGIDDVMQFLETSLFEPDNSPEKSQSINHSLQTPPQSSPTQPSNQLISFPDERVKQLRFSSETNIIEPSFKDLPPSKQQKSSKSILKPFDPAALSNTRPSSLLPPPHTFDSFATMLESIVVELARATTHSRSDAYQMIANNLKAHDEVPDMSSFLQKLSLLEQFLRRDIEAKAVSNPSPQDKQTKIHALQLSVIIASRLKPSHTLDREFTLFLVDHVSSTIGDEGTSKEMLRHELNVLACKEIYPSNMDSARFGRLFQSLSTLHDRVSGNSIIQLRLMVYKRLIQYNPEEAVNHVESLLRHIFNGILSSDNDIRARALETGSTLGVLMGDKVQTHQALQTLLESETTGGTLYSDRLQNRLRSMLEDDEECQHVPIAWGISMLVLRGSPMLRAFLQDKSWLKIIQHCFNSSDAELNLRAWTAWNQTICAGHKFLPNDESLLRRLCQPIIGHLHRNGLRKPIKKAVFTSFYTLLYYTFGQNLKPAQVLMCWNRIVTHVCNAVLESSWSSTELYTTAVRKMLLNDEVQVWTPNRVLDFNKGCILPRDIPKLSAPWVRRNMKSVLETLEPVLNRLRLDEKQGILDDIWTDLLKSVVRAGEKEVKSTIEFKSATTAIVNMLDRITFIIQQQVSLTNRAFDSRIAHMCYLVRTSILLLGSRIFSERFILINSSSHTFEVDRTPPKKISKVKDTLMSPISIIFNIMSISLGHCPDLTRTDVLKSEVDALLKTYLDAGMSTCYSKIDAIAECAEPMGPRMPSKYCEEARVGNEIVWPSLAKAALVTLDEIDTCPADSSRDLGLAYVKVMSVIKQGFRREQCADDEDRELSVSMLQRLRELVERDFGDAGHWIIMIEPVLEDSDDSDLLLYYLSDILRKGIRPFSRRRYAKVWSTLFDSPPIVCNFTSFPWYHDLYQGVDEAICLLQDGSFQPDYDASTELIWSLADFIKSSATAFTDLNSYARVVFDTLAQGVSGLILSGTESIPGQQEDEYSRAAAQNLWETMLSVIPKENCNYVDLLSVCTSHFCAAFRSKYVPIVNAAIVTWNSTFGTAEYLRYPEVLGFLLHRVKNYANISLPRALENSVQDKAWFQQISVLPTDDASLLPWIAADDSHVAADALPPRDSQEVEPLDTMDSTKEEWEPLLLSSPSSPSYNNDSQSNNRCDPSQVESAEYRFYPLNLESVDSQCFTTQKGEAVSERQNNSGADSERQFSPTQQQFVVPREVFGQNGQVENCEESIERPDIYGHNAETTDGERHDQKDDNMTDTFPVENNTAVMELGKPSTFGDMWNPNNDSVQTAATTNTITSSPDEGINVNNQEIQPSASEDKDPHTDVNSSIVQNHDVASSSASREDADASSATKISTTDTFVDAVASQIPTQEQNDDLKSSEAAPGNGSESSHENLTSQDTESIMSETHIDSRRSTRAQSQIPTRRSQRLTASFVKVPPLQGPASDYVDQSHVPVEDLVDRGSSQEVDPSNSKRLPSQKRKQSQQPTTSASAPAKKRKTEQVPTFQVNDNYPPNNSEGNIIYVKDTERDTPTLFDALLTEGIVVPTGQTREVTSKPKNKRKRSRSEIEEGDEESSHVERRVARKKNAAHERKASRTGKGSSNLEPQAATVKTTTHAKETSTSGEEKQTHEKRSSSALKRKSDADHAPSKRPRNSTSSVQSTDTSNVEGNTSQDTQTEQTSKETSNTHSSDAGNGEGNVSQNGGAEVTSNNTSAARPTDASSVEKNLSQNNEAGLPSTGMTTQSHDSSSQSHLVTSMVQQFKSLVGNAKNLVFGTLGQSDQSAVHDANKQLQEELENAYRSI